MFQANPEQLESFALQPGRSSDEVEGLGISQGVTVPSGRGVGGIGIIIPIELRSRKGALLRGGGKRYLDARYAVEPEEAK